MMQSWFDSLSDTRRRQFMQMGVDQLQAVASGEIDYQRDHGKRPATQRDFEAQVEAAVKMVDAIVEWAQQANLDSLFLDGGFRVIADRVRTRRA